MDLGIYPIAMTSLIFGGGRPEHIKATGYLTDTGVDELASITIKYPGKNMFPLCVRQSSGAFIAPILPESKQKHFKVQNSNCFMDHISIFTHRALIFKSCTT